MKVKVIKRETKQPTKEEIISYLKGQGYPDVNKPNSEDRWMVEEFALPDNYEKRYQYWQAVYEDIDLCDFDRWQYFQKVIGNELSYEDYQKIDEVFYKNDIEVLEMPCDTKTLWGN